MRKLLMGAFAALLLTGCVTTQDKIVSRDQFLAEATRSYTGVSKEQVIRAAQAVLLQSDDADDWDFGYTTNGFTGTRKYFVYAVIAATSGREKWEFNTEQVGGAVQASLTVSDLANVGTYGTSVVEINLNRILLQRLFWKRVDYVLGRRPDWVSCDEAMAEAQAAKADPEVLSGLCGFTSEGKKNPPPQRIVNVTS
ncbi:hypothetical protein FHS85_005283 [Rhodoligotrophos appendicifer]|uniref:membrane lipoprotein lipid attachment site-containing protein n=1 Tax=Rhodoligotrophos appendicifer TaxID=987056 RepID=UPI0011846E96|nr:membrane lipoprotein lipid attachment site-containing protein [Rhodoligotrophos appendicifer]